MGVINREYILKYLRENKKLLRDEFGVTKIALFGSFARNEERPDRDVDLLIESEIVTFDNRYNLKEHLEKKFGRKVDVTYFESVRIFYRRFIDKDLIYA